MAQEVPLSTCEVVILTALSVEFRAVVAHLQETQEIVHPQGTIYRVGSFLRESGQVHVAVAQIGMGGGSAALETERPSIFFALTSCSLLGLLEVSRMYRSVMS